MQQFKAHKSLEAYNQFACGWDKDVTVWTIKKNSVVTGRVSFISYIFLEENILYFTYLEVRHSQR